MSYVTLRRIDPETVSLLLKTTENCVRDMEYGRIPRRDIIISYPHYFQRFIEEYLACKYLPDLWRGNFDKELFGCPVQFGYENKIVVFYVDRLLMDGDGSQGMAEIPIPQEPI